MNLLAQKISGDGVALFKTISSSGVMYENKSKFVRMKFGNILVNLTSIFYLPGRRRPGTGDITTPPVYPSIYLSVMFSFRIVIRKSIDIFSQNFAGTCTMSWGCAV